MATIKVNDTNKIVIDSFKTSQGKKFLNVRKFYRKADDDEDDWKPTKQGISVPEEKAEKFIKRFKEELANIDENARELEDKSKSKKKKKDDEDDEKPKKKKKKVRRDEEDDE